MTAWRMRIAYRIPKAINTHSEYAILLVFHCNNGYTNAPECCVILGDQKVAVHRTITGQKKCKNILNSFIHLP
jgi:hypothetical protein